MLDDLRFALRQLRRTPLGSGVIVASLALGVGAVSIAFTLVRGVLLLPLEYPEAGRLMALYHVLEPLQEAPNPRLAAMWDRLPVSYLNAADWRRQSRALAGIGLYADYAAVLEDGGEPRELPAARIDASLPAVLGVEPLLGRVFAADEVARGERLVLLGHALWRSAFGGDPGLVGRTLRLDGEPHVVVGVMPPGFAVPGGDELLWTPLVPDADDLALRDNHRYPAVARLAAGVTPAEARAELADLAAALAAAHPGSNTDLGARLVPLLDVVVGDSRRSLGLLSAAAALVLALACLNAAQLLLARGLARRHELAVRLALGAGRWRLVRGVLAEAVPLAVAGGGSGLLLAAGALAVLPRLVAGELPRLEQVEIDGAVALFAFAAGLAAAVLAALAPALRAPAVAPRAALGQRVAAGSGGGAGGALVVAEVALTLVLAAGAGLLAASWLRLAATDPGFDARGVLVQQIRLPPWSYPDDAARRQFGERLLRRLEALPGVAAAALTSRLPVPGPGELWGFEIVGGEPTSGDMIRGLSASMLHVSPGFHRLLGIPLVAGHPFDTGAGDRPGVLVNRTLADRYWPGGDAVGAEMRLHDGVHPVLGVVEDSRQRGLAGEAEALILQPWERNPRPALAALVAAGERPLDRAADLRRVVRRLDPALPLPPAEGLGELVQRSLAGPRYRALLVGLSAGLALLLALVGIYSVMAVDVGRRRREIGVRMALGADRARVRRLILGRVLRLALAGVALGTAGVLAAGRLLTGFLHAVEPADPLTLAGAAALLVATCLAAGYLPARQAARHDCAVVLRGD